VLTVTFAGQVVTGGSTSFTVTVKLQVLVLPWPSLALQRTVVVPRGNANPLAGTQLTVAAPQLSVAVGTANVTLLEQLPTDVLTMTFPGHGVMAGGSVSLTVTVKLHPVLLPCPSFALQFTVVVPRGKEEPLTGEQVTVAVPQLSVAVAVKVTLLAQLPPEVLTDLLAGQVIAGGSASATVTVNEHCVVLP
jgi:hypothetical protein